MTTQEKRKATLLESKALRKGIANRKKKLTNLKKEYAYFNDFVEFNKKWKDYLEAKEVKAKKGKEEYTLKTLEGLKDTIKFEKESMGIEQDQLENGITIKRPTGVN